jgi:hypothetical protein
MIAHDCESPFAAVRESVRRVGKRIEVHGTRDGRTEGEPDAGSGKRGEDVRESHGDAGDEGSDAGADERERRRTARHVGPVEYDQPADRDPRQERHRGGACPNGPHR